MDNMYKSFRKFLKKVKTSDIDVTKKVHIRGYNWSLANGQFWAGDDELSQTNVELLYTVNGATSGSHNNAMYQALIYADGRVVVNGNGLNKRMDKMLYEKAEEIRQAVFG